MNTKLYTAIYVVLFVAATAQVLIEFAGLAYWTAFWVIMALSAVKALFVAAYYQHLRYEPRSITYVMLTGLLAALALTLAAAYSIT
ncbi:cytochrome C oxidase subunit IV family protein [Halomarina halobia]|uniref:Cytochrome C oxidase subunit IV family protein n=1 Tax=Halomarina halobia TaxID=3033386 RepID=A0ABD6A8N6_9EURY|nr:cytochrome C oxidase subunit IV family protein [Halomarina sp. PSR21]